jgi:asparagine synthase (glutamine-hydrolysing)
MPMANQDRSLLITYNGEVYNFAELRRELQAKVSAARLLRDLPVSQRRWRAVPP